MKRSWKVRVGSGTYEWFTKRSVTYRSDERLDRVRIARIVREFTPGQHHFDSCAQ